MRFACWVASSWRTVRLIGTGRSGGASPCWCCMPTEVDAEATRARWSCGGTPAGRGDAVRRSAVSRLRRPARRRLVDQAAGLPVPRLRRRGRPRSRFERLAEDARPSPTVPPPRPREPLGSALERGGRRGELRYGAFARPRSGAARPARLGCLDTDRGRPRPRRPRRVGSSSWRPGRREIAAAWLQRPSRARPLPSGRQAEALKAIPRGSRSCCCRSTAWSRAGPGAGWETRSCATTGAAGRPLLRPATAVVPVRAGDGAVRRAAGSRPAGSRSTEALSVRP